MSTRLGVALEEDRWRWVLVEALRGEVCVVRTGDVAPGEWSEIVGQAGASASVGLALPDSAVVVRRIRVGHPPASLHALRQLARWRLKGDLPFAGVALDARMEGDHALVVVADRARVESLEAQALVCGPVERLTCCGLASLGLVPAPVSGAVAILDAKGHARARYEDGVLVGIQLLEGAPASTSDASVDRRAELPEIAGIAWGDVPAFSRGAFLPAVGAAIDGLRLNLASRPPVPAGARTLAWGVAAAALLLALGAVALAFHASSSLSAEREAFASLAPSVTVTVSSPPELAALRAVLVPEPPAWTHLLSSFERTLPRGARLDRLEWKEGTLRITVVGAPEELETARIALSAQGSTRAISQGGTGATSHAEFAIESAALVSGGIP